MGMNLDVMSVSCRQQLKYIIQEIYWAVPPTPATAAR
jgi:hypothetical protein